MEEIVKLYNQKMEAIRKNCQNDARCQDGNILFHEVYDEKGVIKQLNSWLKDDQRGESLKYMK